MKKATIEYDLSNGDRELRLAMAGGELASLLDDVDRVLRSIIKYESEGVTESVLQQLAEVRASIGQTLSRYRLDEE